MSFLLSSILLFADETLEKVGTYTSSGAYNVVISGNYAYVAATSTGLQIIDISTPSSPTLTGTYNTSGSAYDVAISGNYAYVADYTSGLKIIDISTPSAPTLTGSFPTTSARGIAISGNYAYVADYGSGLKVINISNPSSPSLAATYTSSDSSSYSYDVAISGNYAYVADYYAGLHIINISTPSLPTLTGTYNTSGYAWGVAISGTSAYVADGFAGLQIIDISTPSSPTLTGTYNTSGSAYDVAISGNYAYVADSSSGGLHIIDISTPSAPTLTDTYNTSGTANGIAVNGNYAYVADYGSGLKIFQKDYSDTFPSAFYTNVSDGNWTTASEVFSIAQIGTSTSSSKEISFTLSASSTVSFDYSITATSSSYDNRLYTYIDGSSSYYNYSPSSGTRSFTLAAGTHTITQTFTQNYYYNYSSDGATISNFKINGVAASEFASEDYNFSVSGSLYSGGGDVDIFAITAPSQGAIKISNDSSSTTALSMSLYDENQTLIKTHATEIAQDLNASTYFVKIEGATASTVGDYNISSIFTVDDFPDTFALTYKHLIAGSWTTASDTFSVGPIGRYGSSSYKISVSPTSDSNLSYDYNVTGYSSSYDNYIRTYIDGNTTAAFSHGSPSSGTDTVSLTAGTHTIEWKFTQSYYNYSSDKGVISNLEIGGKSLKRVSKSVPFSFSGNLLFTGADVDIFEFVPDFSGTISITNDSEATTPLKISIYDANQALLTTNTATVTQSVTASTLYYAKVEADANTTTGDYTLSGILVDASGNAYVSMDASTIKEGCFIATAAYGSYFESHVKLLRDFRDNVLLQSSFGKYLVDVYYKYSPPIADAIAENEWAKSAVRILLMPLVFAISSPLTALFILISLLITGVKFRRYRISLKKVYS